MPRLYNNVQCGNLSFYFKLYTETMRWKENIENILKNERLTIEKKKNKEIAEKLKFLIRSNGSSVSA